MIGSAYQISPKMMPGSTPAIVSGTIVSGGGVVTDGGGAVPNGLAILLLMPREWPTSCSTTVSSWYVPFAPSAVKTLLQVRTISPAHGLTKSGGFVIAKTLSESGRAEMRMSPMRPSLSRAEWHLIHETFRSPRNLDTGNVSPRLERLLDLFRLLGIGHLCAERRVEIRWHPGHVGAVGHHAKREVVRVDPGLTEQRRGESIFPFGEIQIRSVR